MQKISRSILRIVASALLASGLLLASAPIGAADDTIPFVPGCDFPAVIVVGVEPNHWGRDYCSSDGAACSDKAVVLAVLVGFNGSVCKGDEDSCSGNAVVVIVMVGNNEACNSKQNACNDNHVMVVANVGTARWCSADAGVVLE